MRFAGTELSNYFSTPDFTGIGRTMMEGASLGRRAVNAAEGEAALAGIYSTAKIKAADYEADAIKAGGQARGQAAIASGIGNMFGGIATGIGYKNLYGARGGGGSTGSNFGLTMPTYGINSGYSEMFGAGNAWKSS